MQYDVVGRRTKLLFKSENRTGYLNLDTYQTYSYNANQQLSRIQRDADSAKAAVYTYDSDGRVTRVSDNTYYGSWSSYGYDASGALTKIGHYSGFHSDSPIATLAYQYDAAGNVTRLEWDDDLDNANTWNLQSGRATITYQYDDLYRLTREYCSPGSNSHRRQYGDEYWYDAVGNRTKMRYYNVDHQEEVWDEELQDWVWVTSPAWEETSYQYSSRNELTRTTFEGTDDTIYTYDLRGNLTKKGSTEYYWDGQDHLTKVGKGGTTTQYKYDLLGRRVGKKVGSGAWNWYFYDGLKVAAEGTSTTNKTFYTNGPGDVGGIVSRGDYYYHYDRLGNVVAVTSGGGNLVDLYTMDAFGNVLQVAQSGYGYYNNTNSSQPYHLTSKEHDSESGLYYFKARWYDPEVGRFASRDPRSREFLVKVGCGGLRQLVRILVSDPSYADWVNSYIYCHNNPTGHVDPDGGCRKGRPPTPPNPPVVPTGPVCN